MIPIACLILTSVYVRTVVLVVRAGGVENDTKHEGERNGHKVIARELNISRNSVRKYLRSEPKNRQNRRKGSKLDPYGEKIRALIDEHNLSAVRIQEEIRKMGYDGGYTILKDYCHELRKDRRIQAVYRYETDPGKQSQVDFGEFGYIDIDGKYRKLYAFSMILL